MNKKTDMKIRNAAKNDISRIVKMLNSEKYLTTGEPSGVWEKADIQEFLSSKRYRAWVCEVDKQIAGVAIIEFHKLPKYAYLYVLAVNPRFRRQGIGTKMMNFVENFAKKQKIKFIWAFTEKENTIMKKFFLKKGYKEGKEYLYFSKRIKEKGKSKKI